MRGKKILIFFLGALLVLPFLGMEKFRIPEKTRAADGLADNEYYLMPSFDYDDEHTLYLWTSVDGLNFKVLDPQGSYSTPILPNTEEQTFRDPSIIQFGKGYYIAHTSNKPRASWTSDSFKVIYSEDLKNWDNIKEVSIPTDSSYVWAPEWFVDDSGMPHIFVSSDMGVKLYETHPEDKNNMAGTWSAPLLISSIDKEGEPRMHNDPFVFKVSENKYIAFGSIVDTPTFPFFSESSSWNGPYVEKKVFAKGGSGPGYGTDPDEYYYGSHSAYWVLLPLGDLNHNGKDDPSEFVLPGQEIDIHYFQDNGGVFFEGPSVVQIGEESWRIYLCASGAGVWYSETFDNFETFSALSRISDEVTGNLTIAGKTIAHPTVKKVVDTIAPEKFVANQPESSVVLSTPSVSFDWTGTTDVGVGVGKYQLWIDGALKKDDISPNDTSVNEYLSNGTHTWQIAAVDKAGNVTKTSNRSLTINSSNPSVTVYQSDTMTTTDNSFSITGKITSNESGISSVTINSVPISLVDQTFSSSVSLNIGLNTIVVVVTDNAGNSKTRTLHITRNPINIALSGGENDKTINGSKTSDNTIAISSIISDSNEALAAGSSVVIDNNKDLNSIEKTETENVEARENTSDKNKDKNSSNNWLYLTAFLAVGIIGSGLYVKRRKKQ